MLRTTPNPQFQKQASLLYRIQNIIELLGTHEVPQRLENTVYIVTWETFEYLIKLLTVCFTESSNHLEDDHVFIILSEFMEDTNENRKNLSMILKLWRDSIKNHLGEEYPSDFTVSAIDTHAMIDKLIETRNTCEHMQKIFKGVGAIRNLFQYISSIFHVENLSFYGFDETTYLYSVEFL
jgi:hypothetical protein